MLLEETSPINKSKTKTNYRFSKDTRFMFKPLKLTHERIGHLPLSGFERIVKERKTGSGTRFGGASRRFDYEPCKRKQGAMPSPADYSSH